MDGIRRLTRITLGAGLIVAGVAMLVLPGPGILAILAGGAMLSGESPSATLPQWLRMGSPENA